jgi:hypothetical protein
METVIDRRDTGIRIALTVLFAIVAGILDTIVGLVVVFGLVWALITRRPPGEGLRSAANRLISFDYRIARYLTYNEQTIPFPFSDFPDPLEEPDWDPAVRESEALGFEFEDDARDDDDTDR